MSEKIRTVRLYGKLGAKFGRRFDLAVQSPAEAVSALGEMIPGFKQYLIESKDKGFGFAVFLGKRNLSKEELYTHAGNEDIRIAPVTFGSKKGGVVQIIVGVVLVVVGAILTYFGYGAVGVPLMKMGAAMIIGGVVQLLMPTPKGPGGRDSADDNPSKYFSGPINTQAQGHPVPVLYGRLLVGSAVISAGIYMQDESPTSDTGSGSKGANGGGTLFLKVMQDN